MLEAEDSMARLERVRREAWSGEGLGGRMYAGPMGADLGLCTKGLGRTSLLLRERAEGRVSRPTESTLDASDHRGRQLTVPPSRDVTRKSAPEVLG